MTDPIDPTKLAYRQTCFEIHIRPMMRLLDHDHMLYLAPEGQTIDLFDYDQVKEHADGILQRLQYNMPTISLRRNVAGGVDPAVRAVDQGEVPAARHVQGDVQGGHR